MSNLKFVPVIIPTILVQLLVLLISPLVTYATSFSNISSAELYTTISFNGPFSLDYASDMLTDFSLDTSPIVTDIASPDTIAIKAINPGYTTGAGKKSGELIELIKLSDNEVSLGNLAIIYTAKPSTADSLGKSTILYRFPEGSKFIGSSILLRFRSAPEATEGSADLFYDASLAMAGSLALVQTSSDLDPSTIPANSELTNFGEVINSVCWFGGEECLPVFSTTVKSRSYTTIVRNQETGLYDHVISYTPEYNADYPGLFIPPTAEQMPDSGLVPDSNDSSSNASSSNSASNKSSPIFDVSKGSQCQGLIFSEILSYYDTDYSEQFIEFYNSASDIIALQGCHIKYKNKYYPLVTSAENISPSEYFVFRPEFRLTKNPGTENTLELYDVNGAVVAKLSYPHGQKKSASYALINYNTDGTDNWQITYAVTPGEANIYQEYKSCPAGKVINESTGNCVNASTISNKLSDCPAGKYRNPLTGRCKSITDSDDTTECIEGYERNPETNRCRKIKNNNGTEYPVVPITGVAEQSTFIALWAIGGITLIGFGYVIFQFRKEIYYFFRKTLFKKH